MVNIMTIPNYLTEDEAFYYCPKDNVNDIKKYENIIEARLDPYLNIEDIIKDNNIKLLMNRYQLKALYLHD